MSAINVVHAVYKFAGRCNFRQDSRARARACVRSARERDVSKVSAAARGVNGELVDSLGRRDLSGNTPESAVPSGTISSDVPFSRFPDMDTHTPRVLRDLLLSPFLFPVVLPKKAAVRE